MNHNLLPADTTYYLQGNQIIYSLITVQHYTKGCQDTMSNNIYITNFVSK